MSAPYEALLPGFTQADVPVALAWARIVSPDRVVHLDVAIAREAAFLDCGTPDAGVAVFRHWGVSGT